MINNFYIQLRNILQIDRLLNLLDIRREESKVVLLLLCYSFSIGVGIYIYYTTATTIFLARFDSKMLPIAYIAGGVFVHLIGRANKYIQQYIKFPSLSILLVSALILSLTILLISHTLLDSKWVVFVIYLWIRANLFVFTFTFWVSASKLFNLNQAKRLYSLIGTGEVLASITANFLVKTLISSKIISVDGLLYIALAFVCLSLYYIILIKKRYGEKLSLKKIIGESSDTDSVKLSNNYSLLMYSLGTIPIACLYIIEFSFSINSKIYFPDKDQLAIFLGQFLFICSIIELAVKGVLFQFVTKTYGIMSGLIIIPIALSVVTMLIFLMLGLDINIFFLILISRFLITAVRRSFSDTSYQLLYQPLNIKESVQLQNQVETYAKPGGYILAGISLLVLIKFNLENAAFIYGALLVFLLVWSALVFIMQKEYRVALLTILSSIKVNVHVNKTEAPPQSNNNSKELSLYSSFEELANRSASVNKEDRIDAALKLGTTGRFSAYKYINKLLEDNDLHVRLAAIESASKIGKVEVIPFLLNNLLIPETRESAKQAIYRIGDAVIPYVDTYMVNYTKQTYILKIFIELVEEIGSAKSIRLLRSKLMHPSNEIVDEVIGALNKLGYSPNTSEELFLMNTIDSKVNMYLWMLSAEIDLAESESSQNLIDFLRIDRRTIMLRLLNTLSFITGEKRILKIEKLLYIKNNKSKTYLSDLIAILIKQKEILSKVAILFDNISDREILLAYQNQYPQQSLQFEKRLITIVHKNNLNILTRSLALKQLLNYSSNTAITILASNVTMDDALLSEVSVYDLKENYPDRFNEFRNYFTLQKNNTLVSTMLRVEKFKSVNELKISKIEALLTSQLITSWNPELLTSLADSMQSIYLQADEEIYPVDSYSALSSTGFIVGSGAVQATYIDNSEKTIKSYDVDNNPEKMQSIKALTDTCIYIVGFSLSELNSTDKQSLQIV